MPERPLRVALSQLSARAGDVEANVRAAERAIFVAADRGAHLVVFPELFLTGYELAHLEADPTAWLGHRDPRLDPVRRACKATAATAILGAAHRTPENERVIAAPIISPDGDHGMSIKEHLHGSEVSFFRPGLPSAAFEVHGWRVAIGICFDASKPSHAESAARSGADLYVVSALYFRGEERRADLHLGARAMDNRVFSVLANHAGITGGHASCGLSGAWCPSGEVLRRTTSADEEVLVVELDPTMLERYRK